MSTKLKAMISGHRSAFTKLVKTFEDRKSNEDFFLAPIRCRARVRNDSSISADVTEYTVGND